MLMGHALCAQIPLIDSTLARLRHHIGKTPQEKVYIRTNKEIFTRGETVWFAAYVVDEYSHAPSQLSGLLHVDLIGPSADIISSLPLKITNGVAYGEFLLSHSFPKGQYAIRGYTRYMKNFDAGFIFNRPIQLVDFSGIISQEKIEKEGLEVQFFPEGGDLIPDQLNFVAFKATNAFGEGVPVDGVVMDDRGNEVSRFKVDVFGMGKFQLSPKRGTKYKAKVFYKNEERDFDLPSVVDDGYLMHLRQTSNHLFLTVEASNHYPMEGSFVIAHRRGNVFLVFPYTSEDDYLHTKLSLAKLPTGICHFTFFDGTGFPRAERLFFNYGEFSNVNTSLDTKSQTVQTRKRAKFDIKIASEDVEELSGSVSVAILANGQYGPSHLNIERYLTLTSDLVGKVENPAFYFDTTNLDYKRHMDLLMLTHGWRRFNWEEIVERKLPPINFHPETGFSIEGKVVKYLNRKSGVHARVSLTFLENIAAFIEANSEEDGTFWFDGLQVEDTVTAIINTVRLKEDENGKLVEAKGGTYIQLKAVNKPVLSNQFPDYLDLLDWEKMDPLTNSRVEEIGQSNLRIQNIEAQFDDDIIILDEVEIRGKRDKRRDPFFRESMVYRRPDSRLVLDSLPSTSGYLNIFELLKGKVPSLDIRGQYPGPYQIIIRGYSTILGDNSALILVNGSPASPSFVESINPIQIAFVDVLRGSSATLYGAQGNGVVAIYLKEDFNMEGGEPDPVGLLSLKLNGFYPSKEFYVPQYDKMNREEKLKPDYRSTLYWNPRIELIKGKGYFEFFTSDERDDYTIYVEGITSDGRIIQKSFPFKVN